jgi:elongation factor Ts
MSITASMVAELREKTGAGMLDCKRALDEVSGDMEKAINLLREKGMAKALKRAGKVASEGMVNSYIHQGGRVGVLVEVNCETDFVAKTDKFQAIARDIALHIAGAKPMYVSSADIPMEIVENEKALYLKEVEGKPEEVKAKIVEGKLNKFYSEVCLLNQSFIKDEDKTIEKLLQEATAEIGEKVSVRRFSLFVLGEGIKKEEVDFASEVEAQLNA